MQVQYRSEVTSHSLATLLLDSRHSMLVSLQVLAQFYESRGQRRVLDWLARKSFALLSTLDAVFSASTRTILRESRPTSCTRLVELDHSRVCQLCHSSDEFEYFTAAGSLARASLVWLDLYERISLDLLEFLLRVSPVLTAHNKCD